jgi:hypothetical protein
MSKIDVELLAEVERRSGRVTPQNVVDAARSPRHPWHARFCWSDKIAGARFRLDQARELIANVTLTIRTETTILSAPHYVRDPDLPAGEQGYVSVVQLRTEEGRARAALLVEVQRVSHMLRRMLDLARILDLDRAVQPMLAQLDEVTLSLGRLNGGGERPDVRPN